MTTPRWPIRALIWGVAAAAAAVAGWYGPTVTAATWHVFHPTGWVSYRGLRVKVPWPWVSDVDAVEADPTVAPEGIAIKRTAYTMARRQSAQAIFITVISPEPDLSPEQQVASWMNNFRATHPGREFDETPPVAAPPGASCLGARPGDEHDIVWTCISVSGGWIAVFEGHARDEPTFFRIVADLKR
jgi:hypothetical protein